MNGKEGKKEVEERGRGRYVGRESRLAVEDERKTTI